MKTVNIPPQATDVSAIFEQAREQDILVRAADGTEFFVTVVDDFDAEVARTRQNARLMALLEERARQERTLSLAELKNQHGLE